ncbi:RCC1 domain-containing protein [Geomonas propionica]|uniref:S8 family serine peptidase n=1 Tax=Geomonas propionica TaxID=2798582 RepID=A0ABS0YVL4_9BACT|nr:S8 family serine peptidase [Geomonas propionica]MBJ6801969.1 S8 family serine peptidase [Geomonas propionica]
MPITTVWPSLKFHLAVAILTCTFIVTSHPAMAAETVNPSQVTCRFPTPPGRADSHTALAPRSVPGPHSLSSPPSQEKKYARGRFIVKFADTLTEPADVIHGLGLSFASQTAGQGAGLDELHKKHKIKGVKPLFHQFFDKDSASSTKKGLLAKRKRNFADRVAQIKAKYQRRAQRASKGSKVPDLTSVYLFETADDADVEAVAREYAANPNVLYAVPAYQYQTESVPNDPFFSSWGSWGYNYDDLWGLKKIEVAAAWDVTKGDGVIVGVVDTGLDYNHVDIVANVWSNLAEEAGAPGADDDGNGFVDDSKGWDFAYGTNDPIDHFGHGTHVTGTIAATGDNGIGVPGIAYHARIMPVKGLDDYGSGYNDRLANAIIYAAQNGADVINNSWGCWPCGVDPVVEDAVRTAHALGSVVVVAAGNSGSDAYYGSPGSIQDVVTVGSTGVQDVLSSFSNSGYIMDLVAPGGDASDGSDTYNILSLRAAGTETGSLYLVGTDYIRLAGTSMAAPHVSGVAALILAANPDLTREQVISILRHSADDQVGPAASDKPGFDPFYAWGRLNAARALSMAFSPPADPAILKVPVTSLDFSLPHSQCGEQRSLVFDLFNIGGGNLNWSAEAPSWLTVTSSSTNAPATASISCTSAENRQGVVKVVTSDLSQLQDVTVAATVIPDARMDNCNVVLSEAMGDQGWQPPWNVNAPGIPDGQGGAFYVFEHVVSNPNLSMQRIDSHGVPLWRAGGVPLTITPVGSAATRPALASDGNGGFFVAYADGLNAGENANRNIKLQHVDGAGTLLWGNAGIGITQIAGTQGGNGQTEPRIAADGSGGVVIAWLDSAAGRVKLQRVDATGAALWPAGGVTATVAASAQFEMMMAGDGQGGAFVSWTDRRRPFWDIYAQHIDGNGNRQWTADGLMINTPLPLTGGFGANVVSDGAGGAIIAWRDFRNFVYHPGINYMTLSDIFAVRLNAAGQHLWDPAGVPVVTGLVAGTSSYVPGWNPAQVTMAADEAGGAIFTWHDARSTDYYGGWDIYAQRLDAQGNAAWQANGVPVSTGRFSQISPAVAADGDGGAFFAWMDGGSGDWDIYTQHVNRAGTPQWSSQGVWVQSWQGNQIYPYLVPLAGGRVAVTWDDKRNADPITGSLTGTGLDFFGKVIQSCNDRDGNGYYDEGGLCGPTAPQSRIAVAFAGPGKGTIESAPAGMSCDDAGCAGDFTTGSTITLTALANSSSYFTGWGGACSGTGSCTVPVSDGVQITANFSRKPLAINYTKLGTGAGDVSMEPGETCAGSCGQYFESGTTVVLRAIPGLTARFDGWGGACSGTGTCTVTVDSDKALTASFTELATVLAGGKSFSVAQLGGKILAWGDDAYGQLGDGATAAQSVPVLGPALAEYTSVAAGIESDSVIALKSDGTVWGWGYNQYGQLGDGTYVNRSTPVQTRLLSGVTVIAAGGSRSYAIKNDGTLWGWGGASVGDGTNFNRSSPVQLTKISGAVAVASGGFHGAAVDSQGAVWTWAYNWFGQLGDGTLSDKMAPVRLSGISGAIAVAAGFYHTLALKTDGTVWAWGYNSDGELGDGTSTNRTTPVKVEGLAGVVAIAAGMYHSVALTADGSVYLWGDIYGGQLGRGTAVRVPTKVSGLSGVTKITTGNSHVLAQKSDGTLWAWGWNSFGQLGDGTTVSRKTPALVQFDRQAPSTTAAPAGGNYTAPQTVTLAANEPATIYYTLDGSEPTTASAVYSAPVTITSSATLKYFARDRAGNAESVKSQFYTLTAPPSPVADFPASVTAGDAPLSVSFTDLSNGAPTSWLWNFGDASTSTLQNPQHTYYSGGSYTVSLTVTNWGGSSTMTKAGYISVTPFSLQRAYDTAADGGDIKVRAEDLFENPVLDREVQVRISGGFDNPLQQVVGKTAIHGTMRVKKGKVTLDGVTFK